MTHGVTRLDIAGRFWIVLGLESRFDGRSVGTDTVLYLAIFHGIHF